MEKTKADPYVSNLFTKKFVMGYRDYCLPNPEVKDIQSLIDHGEYKEALVRMIEYYDVGSAEGLRREIAELNHVIANQESDLKADRESLEAGLSEKAKYYDIAEEGMSLVKRFLDFPIRNSEIDCTPMRELLEDAEGFVNRHGQEF